MVCLASVSCSNEWIKNAVVPSESVNGCPVVPIGIFAQVYIPEQGEQMLHQIGGTVLRIDAPQPAKVAA